MIITHFTSAFRSLRKRTAFSLINIFGLAIGVCAFLVILKYIDFETSYDNFHKQASSIYRVNRATIKNEERLAPILWTTYGLGPALKSDLLEVLRYVRVHTDEGVLTWHADGQTKAFHEKKILAVDSSFFRVFTFASVRGDLPHSLDEPNSIVITRSSAGKYFGRTDVIGETMLLTGGRMSGAYTVTAVMEDVPQNSHFSFDFLLPLHNMLQSGQYRNDDGWGSNNFHTYVQLADETQHLSAELKLPAFSRQRLEPKWKEYHIKMELHLQPLREIHTDPVLARGGDAISYQTIYFFGLIAIFILCIAWVNYINLSTARAMERGKEVGIRKSVGAFRTELVAQFLSESFVINIIGIVLAMVLATALLPVLGNMIGKQLSFDYGDGRLWLVLAALCVAGGLASGLYPSFVLSSFGITRSLKGQTKHGSGYTLRKALVVFQFSTSLILIAGTFAVYHQITYMRERDKGLNMEQVLVVTGPGTIKWEEAQRMLKLMKEELKKIPGVKAVATSGSVPGAGHNWGADVRKYGAALNEIKLASVVWVDPEFIPLYDMEFAAGKNFDPSIRSDMKSIIINEAAVKAFDLGTADQALQQQLILEQDTATIIGVLKNYNWNSLKTDFTPFIFMADEIVPMNINIQLQTTQLSATVDAIGDVYKELIPGEPYDYHFLDEAFQSQYKSDAQFGKIFGLFAGLAIAISCLGLWGLASFTTSQRLKEIGIRKVLGATPGSIVYLLGGQFMKLALFAAVVAIPFSWYFINKWLNGFAFRIGLEWKLFIIPMIILALFTMFTVSLQVLKGAMTNPAKVLKSE